MATAPGGAGIIAASTAGGGAQFQGLAPRATIVPVRVSEQRETDGRVDGDNVDGARLAQAIDLAADPDQGNAQVINLSLVMTEDHPAVRSAVRGAVDAGVVLVAAAGNFGRAEDGNPTPYPAAYPGVFGSAPSARTACTRTTRNADRLSTSWRRAAT